VFIMSGIFAARRGPFFSADAGGYGAQVNNKNRAIFRLRNLSESSQYISLLLIDKCNLVIIDPYLIM
jgi:hypothetical protein